MAQAQGCVRLSGEGAERVDEERRRGRRLVEELLKRVLAQKVLHGEDELARRVPDARELDVVEVEAAEVVGLVRPDLHAAPDPGADAAHDGNEQQRGEGQWAEAGLVPVLLAGW